MHDDFSLLDTLDLTGPVELTALHDASWTLEAYTADGTYRYTYRTLDLIQAYTLLQHVSERGVINTAYWTRALEPVWETVSLRFFDFEEGDPAELQPNE